MKFKICLGTLVLAASTLTTTSVRAGPELLLIDPILGVLGSIFGKIQSDKNTAKIPEEKTRSLAAASNLPICSEGQRNDCIKQIGNEIGPIKDSVFHGVAVGFGTRGLPIFASLYENGKFIRFTDIPVDGTSLTMRVAEGNLADIPSMDLPACSDWEASNCIKRYGNEIGPISENLFHGVVVKVDEKGKELSASIYNMGRFVRSTGIPPLGPGFANAKYVNSANAQEPTVNSVANIEQPRKTEEEPKQNKAELEAQRKATELALAEAEEAKRKQAELEAQLVAIQQAQVKPTVSAIKQGKRVALVIGNAKYKFNPLNNPVNDATDMAASLRSVGFDVIEVKDATLKQMREATRRFADKLEVSDVGLVYYSGHGIEVKGTNYLIPVNADIRREYEVVDQAFDASNLLRMMESLQGSVKKRVNILIVDACRNNDLPKSWRSTNSGLARMDAPAGSFISFATAPGQVASDGNGRNSPYTKHLLNALKQPNVPIEQVFKQVRRNVMDETGGEQVHWENSSLIGDFYFTVAR